VLLVLHLHLQAEVLQMEPPELYVRQNPNPNAYTLAITGRKPFIVVHTSLLELLTLPELQAVIAHGRCRLMLACVEQCARMCQAPDKLLQQCQATAAA
jgi:hypothetical protein